MRLKKKLKLNTDSRFGFKIRTMCRMWRFLQAQFVIKNMKNKPVDCYSSHYLTIMSSQVYLSKGSNFRNKCGQIHSQWWDLLLTCPFLQVHQLLTSAARVTGSTSFSVFWSLVSNCTKTCREPLVRQRSNLRARMLLL